MTLLRLALIASLVALIVLMFYQPRALRGVWQRARLIAYIYVATILVSAVLRATGVVSWGS